MSTLRDTSLVIQMAPLDPAMDATPQEFADEMVRRFVVKTSGDYYNVVRQDSAPLTDQGALLLNGTQWYVWDVNTAAYIPADITPSMGIQPTGKWILVSETGTMKWVADTAFTAFLGFGAGSIPAGADNTLLSSLSNVSAWRDVNTALADNSVNAAKISVGASTAGAVLTNVAGATAWSTPQALSARVKTTAEVAPPGMGQTITIARPSGAVHIRAVMRCKTSELGYTAGDEVDIASFDAEVGDGGRIAGFAFKTTASSWTVKSNSLHSSSGTLELANPTEGADPVWPDINNWKIVVYYLE